MKDSRPLKPSKLDDEGESVYERAKKNIVNAEYCKRYTNLRGGGPYWSLMARKALV